MMLTLLHLLEAQSLGFVVAAAAICTISGGLVMHLTSRARRSSGRLQYAWLAGSAIIVGFGVWTTHFIAMLGYRTDIALGYDIGQTLLSFAVGITVIGVPYAASGIFQAVPIRVFLAAIAGFGIAVMHVAGMQAIEGCQQTQSFAANAVAALVGASALGATKLLGGVRHRWLLRVLLFVVGVCGAHFISLAGTVLEIESTGGALSGMQLELSLLTAAAAGALLLAATLALVTARRFDVQEQTHTRALTIALENMSNGILKIAQDETIHIFNGRLLTLLGLKPEQIAVGMPLDAFMRHVGSANGWDDERIGRVLGNHRLWMGQTNETCVEHVFENGRILSITCQPIADGAVLTYDDVSTTRQAQREIAHLAYHDALTGLANRRAFQDRLAASYEAGGEFSLLVIDLDRFKFVNDTFGHGVGDQLLHAVADRLRELTRDTMFLARLGGDEIAIILDEGADRALDIATRVTEAIRQPFDLGDVTVVVGCSVGLCAVSQATNADSLMQQADLALYEAKRSARGRAVPYSAGMIEAASERNRLEADLRLAIRDEQFHLAYQPIQNLANDRIVGYEALIRWKHPERGNVSPVNFIGLAEETGLIIEIGRWVLSEACRQAAGWPSHQHVAVNVSAIQFRSPSLLAHVSRALADSGLPPHRLEIELTETALVEDGAQIAHCLHALRALGVTIAMDDFGTGYSSLAHLRDLPLDRIKIDRSFVAHARDDKHSLAVVRAVTQMGRDMGIETLAEGVETTDQLALLRELGCGAVQGYLIGRPEPMAKPDTPAAEAAA
jgi:diguanylate cyclase (GGDEF)-like protein